MSIQRGHIEYWSQKCGVQDAFPQILFPDSADVTAIEGENAWEGASVARWPSKLEEKH